MNGPWDDYQAGPWSEFAPQEKADPTAGMSALDKRRAGWGKSVADLALGTKQRFDDAAAYMESVTPGAGALNDLIGGPTAADIQAQGRAEAVERKRLDAPLMATPEGRQGHLFGSVATALPAAFVPGANSAAGAAVVGGVQGLLQPTTEDWESAQNAGLGAALGYGATKAINGVANVIKPRVSEAVNYLRQAGVDLTPGQILGGAWKRAEDGLTSLPFVGDAIKSAQRRSFEGLNESVANEALKPIGGKLPKGLHGREAVEFVEKSLGDAYESVLNRMGPIKADQAFSQAMTSLKGMVTNGNLPKEVTKQFDAILKNQVLGKFQGQNAITAQTMKDIESDLGRRAAEFSAAANPDQRALGGVLKEVQSQLRQLVQRVAPPEVSKDLAAANAGWANFKRMQKASSYLGSDEGLFSPEQLLSAVKAADKSRDKGRFARGDALLQELADNAKTVMGRKVPDSGTPLRSLISNPVAGVPSMVVGAPLAGLYSAPGQKAMQAALTQRPALAAPTADELRMLAPYVGNLFAPAAGLSPLGAQQ